MHCKLCKASLFSITDNFSFTKSSEIVLGCLSCNHEYHIHMTNDKIYYEHARFIINNNVFLVKNIYLENKAIIQCETIISDNYFQFEIDSLIDFGKENIIDKIECYASLK